MDSGAWTSEVQWTAVFAANILGTLPGWVWLAAGTVLVLGWLGAARAIQTMNDAGVTRRPLLRKTAAAVMRVLSLGPTALLVLVFCVAFLSTPVITDAVLAAQQRALILNAVLLLLEGVGLAGLMGLLWSWRSAPVT